MIPAIVLTAGLATRLRPLSSVRAKTACPVAGEPLIRRILRHLTGAGVTDAVLNLHHLPHTITGVVGDGSDLGLRIRYSWEATVLGTAGGPRRGLPLLDRQDAGAGPDFLIVNGDTLTDVDLEALAHTHHESGALVTLAVVPNTQPEKYGGVVATDRGIVTGFVPRGSTEPSYHLVGVQAADREAFASVPEHVPYETVGALYPRLIAERPDSIRLFRCTAECLDIGTPSDYLATSVLLAAREGGAASLRGARADVHPSARVERSALWDDVIVEAGATLEACVVTDGVRVPAGTSWRRATLRVADGDPSPGEHLVDGLAVGDV
jgi:NDP-sugar pyrophosphorylase family protein